jgi:tetratricopeptide (TPR) repeat protein
VRLSQQSLKIQEELGNKGGIAAALHSLANVAYSQGNYSEAMRLYQQSLEIEEELGNKSGIASTLGQLGKLARAQGQVKEALRYSLKALTLFEALHSPYRDLVRKDITNIRDTTSEEQFAAWLKELSPDHRRIMELLDQDKAASDEQRAQEFINWLVGAAKAIVESRKSGDAEQQSALAQQLAEAENSVREQNMAEVAEFFAVLRAMLAGEDVTDKIAALVDPLKEIAEQAQAALN